jgi:uncharacterized protein YkwD
VLALVCVGLLAGLLVVLVPRLKHNGDDTASSDASTASAADRSDRPTSTSSAGDAKPTGPPGRASLKSDALAAHNDARTKYQADPLEWDDDLAAGVQAYAERCVFEHSDGAWVSFKLLWG